MPRASRSDDSVTATRRIALPRRSALGFRPGSRYSPVWRPDGFLPWRQEASGSGSGGAGQPAVAQVGETTAGGSTVTGLLHQILLTILVGTAGTMAVLLLGTEAAQGDRDGQPVGASVTTSWCLGALAQRLLMLSFQPDR
jgi:hypothetical protein